MTSALVFRAMYLMRPCVARSRWGTTARTTPTSSLGSVRVPFRNVSMHAFVRYIRDMPAIDGETRRPRWWGIRTRDLYVANLCCSSTKLRDGLCWSEVCAPSVVCCCKRMSVGLKGAIRHFVQWNGMDMAIAPRFVRCLAVANNQAPYLDVSKVSNVTDGQPALLAYTSNETPETILSNPHSGNYRSFNFGVQPVVSKQGRARTNTRTTVRTRVWQRWYPTQINTSLTLFTCHAQYLHVFPCSQSTTRTSSCR